MAAAHTHHAHGSMTQLPKHRAPDGSIEVISRPCLNLKCSGVQVRIDRPRGNRKALRMGLRHVRTHR